MDDRTATLSLAALAQEHRLRIFRLLVREGPSGMAAGDIGGKIGISPTSTSFHLKELERAGLLRATRDGRFIRYAVHVERMRDLLAFLTEDCCQGRPEICGGIFVRMDSPCRPAGDGERKEPADV